MLEHDEKLDKLLKAALHVRENPDERVTAALKLQVAKRGVAAQREAKTVSLWWLPMVLCALSACMAALVAYLWLPDAEMRAITLLVSACTVPMSVLLTVIGVRCFDLKKGAAIAL